MLYDISILGLAYYDKRAGIYRVVENLAQELLAAEECDLSFCAYQGVSEIMATAKYLSAKKDFATIPFRMRGDERSRKALEVALRLHPEPGKGTLLNVYLKTLRFFVKRSGFILPGVDADMAGDVDVFHSTFVPLPEMGTLPLRVKRFVTIYDIIPILHPEFFGGVKDHVLYKVVQSIQPDDFVIVISQATKNDLCSYGGIDPERVFVTPLAASESFCHCTDPEKLSAVRDKYRIPDAPYVLSLSTLEPRKNIAQTIRCFVRFVEELSDKTLHLVLVGSKGWDYGGIFSELKASAAVRDRIILTGFVADEDLAAVYSGATMFVYPSFYEGFGLPPLEAMQCGVPVITSNTSSLPEVVGDAGIMVDPRDADALSQAMSDIYTDSALREDFCRRSLERAKMFSWERCARLTLDAYRVAAGK